MSDRVDPLAGSRRQELFTSMFDDWAFRSWGHVLVGACLVSGLFLGIMVMAEEVVGNGARLTRAAITVALAAFGGYVATAWIIRLDQSADEGLGNGTGR